MILDWFKSRQALIDECESLRDKRCMHHELVIKREEVDLGVLEEFTQTKYYKEFKKDLINRLAERNEELLGDLPELAASYFSRMSEVNDVLLRYKNLEELDSDLQ